MNKKETNPKDALGIKKVSMHVVPAAVLSELGVAMTEGARKYGSYNYRAAGIRGSVYYDAALRHLFQWWEGEDIDPDSGLNHISKALATLVVLRDGMLTNTWTDDRPPAMPENWMHDLNKKAGALIEKYPTSAPAYCNSIHTMDGTTLKAPVSEEDIRFFKHYIEPALKKSEPAPEQPSLALVPRRESRSLLIHNLDPKQQGRQCNPATEPSLLREPVAQADYGNVAVFQAGNCGSLPS